MRDEEKIPLIEYRLTQADNALRQAQILLDSSEASGVINRAYYAMFYASLGLLITKDLGAAKHSGVLSLVDREFVKTGMIPKELSKLLHDAFNQRQKTDYVEFSAVSESRATEILENARRFVEAAKELVSK